MQWMGRRLVLAMCFLAALVPACTSSPDPDPDPAPAATGSPAVNAAEGALLPGTVDQLPDMDVAGFGELRGQVEGTPLVVNLWASWCVPCREEAPDLATAADRYSDRVQFLGVDVQDHRDSAADFIRDSGWSYPSVFDVPGAVMADLGITGPPATLFYAADGTLVRTNPGIVSPQILDRGIRQLLG